jgi:hypothetical protein
MEGEYHTPIADSALFNIEQLLKLFSPFEKERRVFLTNAGIITR